MLSFDYRGKTVLVTGGGNGIGYGIASAFAEAGAKVHVTGTRPAASDYEADLSGFSYHQVQLQDREQRRVLAEAVGELDVLVNNAAQARTDEYDIDAFINTIEANLIGATDLCYRFQPALARSRGAIVNVGSVACFIELRMNPGYTASKAGLLGLTRAIADKWAPDGIRANLVAPGFIETRMTDWARKSPADYEANAKAIPARRFGKVEEVAAAVLFLASPQASYITGQSLVVDGGLLLR